MEDWIGGSDYSPLGALHLPMPAINNGSCGSPCFRFRPSGVGVALDVGGSVRP